MRYLDRANMVTLAGLAAALGGTLLAMTGRLSGAVFLLMVSGICDLVDGSLARRLRRDAQEGRFGASLDSLVDVCAFGFAPAVLMFAAGARSIVEVLMGLVLLISVAWRLARFDSQPEDEAASKQGYHVGLPCTYVALIMPAVFVARAAFPQVVTPQVLRVTLALAALGLSLAMVSRRRIPKPGARWYPVFLAIALGFSLLLALAAPLTPVTDSF